MNEYFNASLSVEQRRNLSQSSIVASVLHTAVALQAKVKDTENDEIVTQV